MKVKKLKEELSKVTDNIPVVAVSGDRNRYLTRHFGYYFDETFSLEISDVSYPVLDTDFLKVILDYTEKKISQEEDPDMLKDFDNYALNITWGLLKDYTLDIKVEDISVEEMETFEDFEPETVLAIHTEYLPKNKEFTPGYEISKLKEAFLEKVGENFEEYFKLG